MRLDREVRHKSEDIEDDVLLDAVKAIRRRVRVVNRDYDIRAISHRLRRVKLFLCWGAKVWVGYSRDGHTVFIDRHLPKTFRSLMKTVRVEPFLLTHESPSFFDSAIGLSTVKPSEAGSKKRCLS